MTQVPNFFFKKLDELKHNVWGWLYDELGCRWKGAVIFLWSSHPHRMITGAELQPEPTGRREEGGVDFFFQSMTWGRGGDMK